MARISSVGNKNIYLIMWVRIGLKISHVGLQIIVFHDYLFYQNEKIKKILLVNNYLTLGSSIVVKI